MSEIQTNAGAGDGDRDKEKLDLNEENAEKVGVDRDGRARPARWSWIIPLLVSLLVAMVFFADLAGKAPGEEAGAVPQVSAKVLSDIGNVLKSQAKTFGLIALYALIPGLFGSIYRKKFWHWFVISYFVLFAFNLIGFLAGQTLDQLGHH